MERELSGRVSLVTGASRGLGKAIALKLASQGSRVAVNYLSNDEAAMQVVSQIEAMGSEVMLVKADVSDSKAVKAMTREIIEKWGHIDILVNNAGITRDGLLPRMSDEAWDTVINTHLRGAYLCTRFALRSMMDRSWGRIINISSVAGVTGSPGQANYSAAKGGLIAFTKSIAREVGSRNITVNAVAPGFIVSDMTSMLHQEIKDSILSRIPLQRFGMADEVAELVAFLAGERAGYITAQVIGIDGGVG
ncbi:MAG: 3-oxoacyl-[acyl-carrier-protein] reductase [Dehalococcoidia bacterium]|nr:3-oxoacyl-[acyl-carrier-protein] reductase [Dehalococcoidia bacterium]